MGSGMIGDINSGLTKAEIDRWFWVHPEHGLFIWKESHGKVHAGTIAGSLGAKGYIYLSFDSKKRVFRAHRVLWFYVHGVWPASDVDHANLDKSDNRILNLRIATRGQNNINALAHRNNTSGRMGISWCSQTNKWKAYLKVDGKLLWLGRHDSYEGAVLVREEAERLHYPNHYRCAA